MVGTLQRMLWRDLWRMRAQAVAAVLVVGCGVATFVAMRSTYASLLAAQQEYYASYRFAELFVHLKKAPAEVASRIAALPGVGRVDARVVADVTLDIPGLAEPATGHIVSVPEQGWPALNVLHLQSGRYVAPGRSNEVMISAAFAAANGLRAGDRIGAVLNGRWKTLLVVGIALSPEYVYEVGAGAIFPDHRHYGVLWMGYDAVAAAFRMDGAFNDLALSMDGTVAAPQVIARIDRRLAPYGGLGAIGREDQLSNRFISDEIAQNRITSTYVPGIFLCVAMFLMQNVLSRLIDMQRQQIGLMKAFGYGSLRIGSHYLQLACLVAVAGSIVGLGAGLMLGTVMTDLYANYYRFARLDYRVDTPLLLAAFALSLGTAIIGAWASVAKVIRLTPVEALHAAVPPSFSAGWGERSGLYHVLSITWRMIVRNLARQPVKALLACLAIACASAILVVGGFFFDAIDDLFVLQFQRIERQDVTVTFTQPLSHRAVYALEHLPGVLKVEPFRQVPIRLVFEHRSRRLGLSGLVPGASLHVLVDGQRKPVAAPLDGILISSQLADTLGVQAGDTVTVEVLDGKRQVKPIRVAGRVGDLVGVGAAMDQHALSQWLGESGEWSGAYLLVDPLQRDHLYATLKRNPAINSVAVRQAMIDSFRKIMDESVRLSTTINFVFACVIAFGVAFNGMRIAYSERIQQLASLRVLGFTRLEVAWILLGEQFVLAGLAIPLGLLLGYGACALLAQRLATDLYRLPLVVEPRTFAYAIVVTAGAVACSGLAVALNIRRLDLIAVLKARET